MSINKESNSLSANVIYDCTPFTHLDYPNHLSCIVWFSECNMRCDYCYNKDIVFAKNAEHSYNDILTFLKSRKNLLDAVVLSGGEATSHNLKEFCQSIKEMGFKIKLDTNGTNSIKIKELLELNLLDYVALDFKAPKEKFQQITYSNKYEDFLSTLDMLISSSIDFEVRTTIHNDLLHVEDVNEIIKELMNRGYNKKYYLQEFLSTESNIGNLQTATTKFDKSLLSNDLEVIWR
ncbi:anaerobic ribonucleoside-triphosphate reductase activating protein [Candidatus Sulfurimonas marisnigri]|uniref:Anaerobic ribonucleoside-triphosphate reductase activating protein n=1 Tax=Candidatus Sulfurimonas marisnigri TaxID=2740405 RepID=A0A7S7M2B2_9BACT|nr:anaerobic ribonucleoside-triphosphate reductase activating protein [Candidatus Sulfurimonas marisnigri]QOY55720.1 anaerobic ribonucleoside-triphosphate reductase activating protein [Candidatus Sulfurimonas marisnigri]